MHLATMFMEYVLQLGHTMKNWIMDNVKFGLSIAYIMGKHEQHYFVEDFIGESWTLIHFVLSHIYIHNIVDLYASLEYKNHKDVAISINVWVDANFVNFFFFQPITIWFKIIWLQIYY